MMKQNRIPLDDNAKVLMKKCEDEEIASQGMGACQVFLEEMDRGNVVLKDEPGESYINISQKMQAKSMENRDVPGVLRIAFIVRDTENITNMDVKNAAVRLIRTIEMF
jgi:hypothetical protein